MKATHKPQLLTRQCLTGAGATREIHHIGLDFGPEVIEYRPGDSLGVYPINQRSIVQSIRAHLVDGSSDTLVSEGKSGHQLSLEDFLLKGANLSVSSPSLVCAIEARMPASSPAKEFLARLCKETSQRAMLVQFSRTKTPEQLLQRYSGILRAQDLCDHLRPLLPRLYSIASAPMWEPGLVDLTVSYVDIKGDLPRKGVCSHWLCYDLDLGGTTSTYLHSNAAFHLPLSSDTPIVMIGAGTGIAPFRAFLQERLLFGARGSTWLIAGQRNRHIDYLYRDFLQTLALGGALKLDIAFSRDQEEKFYVTDLLRESSKELVKQLKEGAILYVCGSIALGKSTHETLLQILQKELALTSAQATDYLRLIRKEGRYRRDVY